MTLSEANEQNIIDLANEIGKRTAVAITNSGQLLFLYRENNDRNEFQDQYELYWGNPNEPWRLKVGNCSYLFQLPEEILKTWLELSSTELDLRKNALDCKAEFLSNMVVYYRDFDKPVIKMISINQYQLEEAKRRFNNN